MAFTVASCPLRSVVRTRAVWALSLLVPVILGVQPTYGQGPDISPQEEARGIDIGEEIFEQFSNEAEEEAAADGSDIDNSVLRQQYLEWSVRHTKRVYGWNLTSSIIIFFVVITMVFLGLYFSYIQFQVLMLNKSSIQEKEEESTIKLGLGGLEITSSIIGLLTLVVSLAFFYLYLQNVYPVRETGVLRNPNIPSTVKE